MNLSKIYSSQENFEPEDLIARKMDSEPVFGSIIAARLPAESQRQSAPPRQERYYQPDQEPEQKTGPEQMVENNLRPQEETVQEMSQNPLEEVSEEIIPPQQQPEPEISPAPEPIPEPETIRQSVPEPESPPPAPPPSTGIPVDEVKQMLAESYDKGVKEGIQQGEDDFGAATTTLLHICQQLDSIRETILRNSVREMQNLVLAIAEKIIRKSVEEQSDTVLRTVEDAIHKAVKSDELYIYVNPDDFDIIQNKSAELVSALSGLNNIVIKREPSIDKGGCRVESDNCTVDATILSQLEIISDQLNQQE